MARRDGPNFSMASFPGAKRVTVPGGRKWLWGGVLYESKRHMWNTLQAALHKTAGALAHVEAEVSTEVKPAETTGNPEE
jgi:hypothetical protein